MLSFLLLLLRLHLYEQSNSYQIFKKVQQYKLDGKMKCPDDMNYFIFDESNITKLDINGNEMNNLYKKQKEIYNKYGVPNYIFAVDSQDESTETLTNTTHNLAEYLRTTYNVKKEDAIILFVSISPSKIKIRTGDKLKKKITDSQCDQMISNIKPSLKNSKYYEAWNKFLSNIIFYPEEMESSSDKKTVGEIIEIVASLVIGFTIFMSISCYCSCKKRKMLSKNFEVRQFLNANKYNNNIYKEYCVLCLKSLNNTEIQCTTQNEFNKTQPQNQNNSNNITILQCGHQFHNSCITKYKVVDCPICMKEKIPSLNGDKEKIIWDIQQGLFPYLSPYIVKTHYENNLNRSGSDYSYPSISGGSIGGGSYGGGSIGGGSIGSGGAQGSF